jgi:hypothetical protein
MVANEEREATSAFCSSRTLLLFKPASIARLITSAPMICGKNVSHNAIRYIITQFSAA